MVIYRDISMLFYSPDKVLKEPQVNSSEGIYITPYTLHRELMQRYRY